MTHRSPEDPRLDTRDKEVLRIVVEEHVKSGEPVGSRRAAQLHSENLSAATIRNIMADLTDLGLLAQPHTSAGRLPTDKGYRIFVDQMLSSHDIKLPLRETRRIQALLASSREIKDLLGKTSRVLAEMTHQVSMVLAPELESAVLEYVDFVRIAPARVVAIFVSRSGLVTHRVVEVEEDLAQDDLDHIAGRFREQFVGMTLPEARARILSGLSEDQAWVELLGRRAVDALRQLLTVPFAEEGGDLIVEGTSALLDAPEFTDLERLREVMRTFEERRRLLRLLDRCLATHGVQVMIGAETEDPSLAPMSVVASTYQAGNLTRGLVGIIGPRRMEYARAVALVDQVARTLSQVLAPDRDPHEPESK